MNAVGRYGIEGNGGQLPIGQEDLQPTLSNSIAGFSGNNQGKAKAGFAQVAHGGELVANGAAIDVEQITFVATRKLDVRRQVVHPRVGSEIGRMGDGGGGFQVARSEE